MTILKSLVLTVLLWTLDWSYVSGDYEDSSQCSRVTSEPPPPPGLAHPTSPWCVFSQFSLFSVSTFWGFFKLKGVDVFTFYLSFLEGQTV